MKIKTSEKPRPKGLNLTHIFCKIRHGENGGAAETFGIPRRSRPAGRSSNNAVY